MYAGCFQLYAYFYCLLNSHTVFSGDTIVIDARLSNTPSMKLPNGESQNGKLSKITYKIMEREWVASIAEFYIDPDLLVTYNNPRTIVELKGESQIKLHFTKDLTLNLTLNLNGRKTNIAGEMSEHYLGGYVAKGNCCITGSGPGAGFLFHGAGHMGAGGGAWHTFSQKYDSSYILGGSTGARINEIDPGTGGGVLRIEVIGDLIIDSNAKISANGYNVLNTTKLVCPGGSSGGYIYIKANTIKVNGQLSIRGGSSGYSSVLKDYCGNGGSGGVLKLNAYRINYGAMDYKKIKSGGRGSTDGSMGMLFTVLIFSKEIVIDTSACTWQSEEFPGYVHQGNNLSMTCTFEFFHDLVIEKNTAVTVKGKKPLKILLHSGSFHLHTMINLTYNGESVAGNTFVGGYHSNGTDQGPGAKEDFATHGDVTSKEGSYGVDPLQLIGGSTCNGNDYFQFSVGGSAIEIKVPLGTVNFYDSSSIIVDAYSPLRRSQQTCGASGGTVMINAKKILFHSRSTSISARGVQGSLKSGHGGVISLIACVRTVYNEGSIIRYRNLHLNVDGGENDGENNGYIKDFHNTNIKDCESNKGVKPTKSQSFNSTIQKVHTISKDAMTSMYQSYHTNTALSTESSRYQSSSIGLLNPSPSPSTSYVTTSISHTTAVRPEIQSVNVLVTEQNLRKIKNQLKDIVESTENLTAAEEEILLDVYEKIAHKASVFQSVEQILEMVTISDMVLNNQLKNSNMKVDVVATRLLESLEEIGNNAATKFVTNDTYTARSGRTLFEISSISNSKSRNSYPTFCLHNDSCDHIELPTKLLHDMTDSSSSITFISMNVSDILLHRGWMTNMTSSLLSIIVNPPLRTPFSSPIKLVQRIENNPYLNTTNMTNIQAWYWRKNAHDSKNKGIWSTNGVIPVSRNNELIVSDIYHLTSFALLVQVTDYKIPEKHVVSLEIITYIGCGLSLFGFLLTFATLVTIRTLSSDRTKIHTNLVAALGIAQLIFLAGINATENSILCGAVAILLHYFFTAAFGWMLAEGVHLYTKVVNVFQDGRSKMKFYHFIGWGTPIILVSISAAVRPDGYGTPQACWISTDQGHIWAFVGPVCLVIFINILIMASVLKVLIASVATPDVANAKTKEQVKAALKAMVILMPILGITWIFGMFAINKQTIFLQYLFTILNSFQGVLIFMFYCVFNTEVRAALKRLHENYQMSKMLSKSTVETSIGANIKDKIKRKGNKDSPGGRKFSRMNSSGDVLSNTHQQSSL